MKSKMTAIFAALMIALMAVGFAYAQWTATLLIDGTVETGDVDAEFTNIEITDSQGGVVPDPVAKYIIFYWMDPTQSIDVDITNAYPSFWLQIDFTIDNLGTVPGKIASIDVSGSTGKLDVTFSSNLVDGVKLPVTGWVNIHVNNNAAELDSLTFTITFNVVAFNA